MESSKIDQLIIMLRDYLPEEKLPLVKSKLEGVDDSKFDLILATKFQKPINILLFAIFLGGFGVDRMMLGQIGLGVLKLIFGWITCGIWHIIDMCTSMGRAKEKNFVDLMLML